MGYELLFWYLLQTPFIRIRVDAGHDVGGLLPIDTRGRYWKLIYGKVDGSVRFKAGDYNLCPLFWLGFPTNVTGEIHLALIFNLWRNRSDWFKRFLCFVNVGGSEMVHKETWYDECYRTI